jgi:hypothetical protein
MLPSVANATLLSGVATAAREIAQHQHTKRENRCGNPQERPLPKRTCSVLGHDTAFLGLVRRCRVANAGDHIAETRIFL